jgi:hypothetical protein
MINDSYLEEVQETQGRLFEEVVYGGGDLVDFVNKFMNSDLKHRIDRRSPVPTNLMYYEQLRELEEEEGIKVRKLRKNSKYKFNDYMLANWIGEFYAYIQWYTQMYSSFIIKLVPIERLIVTSRGLHDLEMQYAVEKVLDHNEMYLKEKAHPTENTMVGVWDFLKYMKEV